MTDIMDTGYGYKDSESYEVVKQRLEEMGYLESDEVFCPQTNALIYHCLYQLFGPNGAWQELTVKLLNYGVLIPLALRIAKEKRINLDRVRREGKLKGLFWRVKN